MTRNWPPDLHQPCRKNCRDGNREPYRVTSDAISSTCGQSISAGGVWNMMQRLSERIIKEEEHAVKQVEADQTEGQREIPVLFEEMDGVWLNMQDEHHKKMKKQEMRKRQYTEADKNQIHKLREEGLTLRRISEKTGCSVEYVQGVLSEP